MAADWRADLSFSDRVAATAKITAAYKNANPNYAASEASKYSKTCESDARRSACTLQEYEELISRSVEILFSSTTLRPAEDVHSNEHIAPNLPSSGAQIGRYRNAEHYRDGLFSEVFKAILPEQALGSGANTLVALKITTPATMVPPHDSIREARILRTASHPTVLQLVETFELNGGRFVLAFPFMPYDLGTVLEQKQLTPLSRRSILRDLFSGLAHIHSLGILHRDIKPSNILLRTSEGPACIADFGIAWLSTDPASEAAGAKILEVGTTCYRAPELLFGNQSYGDRLDMWAAGCVAAQVVSLNDETLFDAGDLGSELALIKSIFETLGTPNGATWPEASTLPDWGKMNFKVYGGKPWEKILPGADPVAVDLVRKLVVYQSTDRLDASTALRHEYLEPGRA